LLEEVFSLFGVYKEEIIFESLEITYKDYDWYGEHMAAIIIDNFIFFFIFIDK
jgi:hypothetical protein